MPNNTTQSFQKYPCQPELSSIQIDVRDMLLSGYEEFEIAEILYQLKMIDGTVDKAAFARDTIQEVLAAYKTDSRDRICMQFYLHGSTNEQLGEIFFKWRPNPETTKEKNKPLLVLQLPERPK